MSEDASKLDSYVARIEERVDNLRSLTKNFLKFVGAESPARSKQTISQIIRDDVQCLRRDLPEDISLIDKHEDRLPPVNIDADQLKSAFENIVANAINALPDGGRVTVRTYLASDLQWQSDDPPHDYVVLEVQDTGVGMSESVQKKLFEPGFSNLGDGTGLGMAIVKKVVEDHHGHVEIESEVSIGSSVSLFFPAVNDGLEGSSSPK